MTGRFVRVAGSAAAFTCLAGGVSAATLAFDNITAGGYNLNTRPFTDQSVKAALIFTAATGGLVTSVEVGLESQSVPTEPETVRFGLYADGGSAPGALLDLGDSVTVNSPAFAGPQYLSVGGWDAVSLTAGTTYWLVAEWTAGTFGAYWVADEADDPAVNRGTTISGAWAVFGTLDPLARITVEPAPIPLPATALLLPAALGALLLRRRT